MSSRTLMGMFPKINPPQKHLCQETSPDRNTGTVWFEQLILWWSSLLWK
uniref:Macaca fascicularis brain cDNA clone: QtrA-16904, similar to human doublecortex; lissencephaly, X-linked (doublecortin)(DCX), transcript variant 3, mRNA, RefSeq: NM_178153.1 n=1 Tax=Macaca fascicularis TaxID=9541 RepID=I7GKQ3_MACFA|nr:unnamed protein product [Macaca fascicularis]